MTYLTQKERGIQGEPEPNSSGSLAPTPWVSLVLWLLKSLSHTVPSPRFLFTLPEIRAYVHEGEVATLMPEEKPKGESREDRQDPEWENFKDFVKKIGQVPKEELDEKLAERKREKKEKRA
jgi:hypothetical protein